MFSFPIFLMQMFTYAGSKIVSMAQPFFWRYLIPLNTKLFRVNIRCNNLIITGVAIGFLA